MNISEVKISDITIGDRFRKEMGDIEGLAQSIREGELLQPIGITPDHELVFGERRLRAYRDILGRDTIPARIVDVPSVLLGQIDENVLRKEFTLTEQIAIVDSLGPFKPGGDRRSDHARNSQLGSLTLAAACKLVGISEDTYRSVKKVGENGVPELVQAMDSGKLSIHAAETLAQASADEQQEWLTRGIGEARTTARSIQAQLWAIRHRKERQDDLDRVVKSSEVVLPMIDTERPAINSVMQGDCRDVIPRLPDNSIGLGLVSPPYAQQRDGQYPGVPEEEYPAFTVDWMTKLWPKLTDDGSVLIVIDPHVENGVLADYVLRTQLALRDAGWKQHMTLMWLKENRCPLGHVGWPRHAYEQILWFSKTAKPFCNPKSGGKETDIARPRYRYSSWSNGGEAERGIKRISDVIDVPVGLTLKGVDHPAMFPVELAEFLIRHFCRTAGTVWDGFTGSGNSLLAAARLGHPFYGCDITPKYVELAQKRLVEAGSVPMAG